MVVPSRQTTPRTLHEVYDASVAAGRIAPDAAQRAVLPAMEALRIALVTPSARRSTPPEGLYLWGDVGRGKSMLVDLLLDCTTVAARRRVHFHAFLLDLHSAIHAARRSGAADPVRAAVDASTGGLALLALDEMDVSDIGDAMILDRVFARLLERGVRIVSTSNRPPDRLYRSGLKRELFLPFMRRLETHLRVVELASPTDWRRVGAARSPVWFLDGDEGFDRLWRRRAPGPPTPLRLAVLGRSILLPWHCDGAVRAGFADLCAAALGPADHRAIAGAVRVLFLDATPRLGQTARDQIRRFVTLVDELYEYEAGLVVRGAAPADALVSDEMASEETGRMLSRLAEMSSESWARRSGLDLDPCHPDV